MFEGTATLLIKYLFRFTEELAVNIKKNEDGSYTDYGNMVMNLGELYIHNLYEYDQGKTLGFGLSLQPEGVEGGRENEVNEKKYNKDASIKYGEKDWDRTSEATIGKGNITIEKNPEELNKANRDINKPREGKTHRDTDDINYSPGMFGKLAENVKGTLDNVGPAVQRVGGRP